MMPVCCLGREGSWPRTRHRGREGPEVLLQGGGHRSGIIFNFFFYFTDRPLFPNFISKFQFFKN